VGCLVGFGLVCFWFGGVGFLGIWEAFSVGVGYVDFCFVGFVVFLGGCGIRVGGCGLVLG